MIQIDEMKMPISPAQARNILQMETDSFGSFFDLDRILEHESFYLLNIHKNIKEWRQLAGAPRLEITKKKEIASLLVSRFGISEYKLGDEGSLSIKKETVAALLKDPMVDGDAQRFLELYQKLNAWAYMVSYFGQYKELPISKVETFDGNRMVVAHPLWNLLATSRISAQSPSLQNVNRDVSDIYTAPKGYQIVFSDSGQIEPRITYSKYIRDDLIMNLITKYNDAYYGLLHYIKLSPLEEASLRQNPSLIQTHEITKAMEEGRQRLKVLGLAGNYGSSNLSAVDAELGPLYEQKIVNHHARIEWEKVVREEVKRGADTFYGAFGSPITPDETQKYRKGERGWSEHLVRCGINNPIQATASELMCFSIYHAKQVMGTECHINYYKHDEGSFYVPEDKVDFYAPKLQGCLSYQVRGWIPIYSDLHVGKKESKNDTRLFG